MLGEGINTDHSFRCDRRIGCVLGRAASILLVICAAGPAHGSAEHEPSPPKFRLDDYFQIRRFSELAISPEGTAVVYVAETQSIEDDATKRTAYLQETTGKGDAKPIQQLNDARDLTWSPQADEIFFISDRSGPPQVFAYEVETGRVGQITHGKDAVVKYRVGSRDGVLAYMTRSPSESLIDRIQRGGTGFLVDPDIVGRDLIDPTMSIFDASVHTRLWLGEFGKKIQPVALSGEVQEFYWSSDARFLSVTYFPTSVGQYASVFRQGWTSVGVLDTVTGNFKTIAEALLPGRGDSAMAYAGGEWVPGSHRIKLRRTAEVNPWFASWIFPEVATIDAMSPLSDRHTKWTTSELHPDSSKVIPVNSSLAYLETRLMAQDTLLAMTKTAITKAHIGHGLQGSLSKFQFSDDFKTVAFINQDLTRPPEIYVQTNGAPPRQLSHVNATLSKRLMPVSKEVTWTSTDGMKIHGWLLLPHGAQRAAPLPLLTYVHGGPGSPVPNRFAPISMTWPYPLEVLAVSGTAVFIPQYRGTRSFGRQFATPSRIDKEPIEDIVTGVEFLVEEGIADHVRLGIAGHSHGAWLGPLVATRTKIFRAASFAEGLSNQVTMYDLFAGLMNREIHETGMREPSLYDNPQRYLDLSPELHFRGMQTATLLEAGMEANAIDMLGMAKAARRAGVPSEFIVYPKTGHVIRGPRLQKDSAERNYDWLQFWLLNREDSNPEKSGQYNRWRALRMHGSYSSSDAGIVKGTGGE